MHGEVEILRRFQKTAIVGTDVTSHGRLFQGRLPVTGNEINRVRRITVVAENDDDRRQRRLESLTASKV